MDFSSTAPESMSGESAAAPEKSGIGNPPRPVSEEGTTPEADGTSAMIRMHPPVGGSGHGFAAPANLDMIGKFFSAVCRRVAQLVRALP